MATKDQIDVTYIVMEYYVSRSLPGCKLKHRSKWDGKDKSFGSDIKGRSDSKYEGCKARRGSVSGWGVHLGGAMDSEKRSMLKKLSLSVTEA